VAIVKAALAFLAKDTEKGVKVGWKILNETLTRSADWSYAAEILMAIIGMNGSRLVLLLFLLLFLLFLLLLLAISSECYFSTVCDCSHARCATSLRGLCQCGLAE
jgi:hypothetical protein